MSTSTRPPSHLVWIEPRSHLVIYYADHTFGDRNLRPKSSVGQTQYLSSIVFTHRIHPPTSQTRLYKPNTSTRIALSLTANSSNNSCFYIQLIHNFPSIYKYSHNTTSLKPCASIFPTGFLLSRAPTSAPKLPATLISIPSCAADGWFQS